MQITRQDGSAVWVETTYSPVHGENGTVTGVVGILRDITHIKEMEEMLTNQSEIANATDTRDALEPVSCITAEPSGTVNVDTPGETGNRPLDDVLCTIEKREILAALRRAGSQRTLAAQLLRISRSRLYRRMEALGIDPRSMNPQHEV